MVSNT
jgi:hypothetical protein